MAIDDQEEYEQGEQVRIWLRQNGISIIGGIAVGLALIAGWQWWGRKQDMQGQQAAMAYQSLSDAIEAKDDARLKANVQGMQANFGKTIYANMASLRVAEHQVQSDDLKGALATLDALDGKTIDPGFEPVVRLRAARLLIAMDKPADAIKRMASVKQPAFAAEAAELLGDAQVKLGNLDAARAAYSDALSKTDAAAPNHPLIEMKLADLGVSAPEPKATKA